MVTTDTIVHAPHRIINLDGTYDQNFERTHCHPGCSHHKDEIAGGRSLPASTPVTCQSCIDRLAEQAILSPDEEYNIEVRHRTDGTTLSRVHTASVSSVGAIRRQMGFDTREDSAQERISTAPHPSSVEGLSLHTTAGRSL